MSKFLVNNHKYKKLEVHWTVLTIICFSDARCEIEHYYGFHEGVLCCRHFASSNTAVQPQPNLLWNHTLATDCSESNSVICPNFLTIGRLCIARSPSKFILNAVHGSGVLSCPPIQCIENKRCKTNSGSGASCIDKSECFSLISRPSPAQLDGRRITFMK